MNLNVVQLAISDLTTAAAILRTKRSGVNALDVRELAGGASALAAGPIAFDRYLAALDAGLSRVGGLTSQGYYLRRAAP